MTYDFIIVGAGSAGCILADHLTRCGRYNVLLLEAGPNNRGWSFQVPAGYLKHYFNPDTNWMFSTEPEPELGQRRLYVPRGKVVGGSGAINAMIYVRGRGSDFDDWRAAGNPGWGHADLLPYFERLESAPHAPTRGRGRGGPIGVTPMAPQAHPLCQDFLRACDELDLPRTPDFNGDRFEGAGVYETNIRRGRRSASGNEHLAVARRRPNLSLVTRTLAARLLWSGPSRIDGVEAWHDGQLQQWRARRGVILCAGAVGSPQLLQVSGIGDADWLQPLGVPVRVPLPGVGRNLQDHLCVSYYFRANRPTLNDTLGRWPGRVRAALDYALRRSGPLSISINQAGGFFRSRPSLAAPNLQLYFNPLSYHLPENRRAPLTVDPYSGFLVAFNACRPRSRGQVRIASGDPLQPPLIEPQYLSAPEDIEDVLQGHHLVRALMATRALGAVTQAELEPGPGVQSDDEVLQYFRRHSGSIYHLCGTCAMKPRAQGGVVDARLQVHGVAGLRVADASVFPNITSGNTNAATMAVAEKAADLILQDTA